MLALTGQRKSEVAEARWSEFDLAKKLWEIPAERMKSDAGHAVPLSDEAVRILESLPRFTKGDYLFSASYGVRPVVGGFAKAKHALDVKMRGELRRPLAAVVIHDIHRTMRTGLSALPVPDLIRELVIAHTKPGLHKVYDHGTPISMKSVKRSIYGPNACAISLHHRRLTWFSRDGEARDDESKRAIVKGP